MPRINTAAQTITKAISVPTLTISSSLRIGVRAATRQIMPPVTHRGDVRRAEARMDRAEDRRQQSVAGHGHEDSRLAQEQHQQHAGHAGQSAGRDQRGRHAQQTGSAWSCAFWANATAIGALMSICG